MTLTEGLSTVPDRLLPRGPGRPVRDSAAAGLVGLLLCAALAAGTSGTPSTVLVGAALDAALVAFAVGMLLRRTPRVSGPADRVTLTRAVLIGGCSYVGVLMATGAAAPRTWWLLPLVVPAVALDAVDGFVARRTGTASRDGGLFDQEMDAALLMVLSVAAVRSIGWWALAIGGMRYAFLVLGWARAQQRGRLPYSRFRRAVAGAQGVLLVVGLTPGVPLPVARTVVAVALLLLCSSFGRDMVWLERQARSATAATSS